MSIIKIFGFIGLQILTVYVIPMFFTFFSEWLYSTGFFGDYVCDDKNHSHGGEYWHWGIRHHLYFWMCLSLFALNLIRAFTMSIIYANRIAMGEEGRK